MHYFLSLLVHPSDFLLFLYPSLGQSIMLFLFSNNSNSPIATNNIIKSPSKCEGIFPNATIYNISKCFREGFDFHTVYNNYCSCICCSNITFHVNVPCLQYLVPPVPCSSATKFFVYFSSLPPFCEATAIIC